MTDKKIKQLADFMYASNNANEVPFRISLLTGMYAGIDLSKSDLVELLKFLRDTNPTTKTFKDFLEQLHAGEL